VRIVRHAEAWRHAVIEYNERVRPRGGWTFYADPECDWLPQAANARVWREYHLAVDAGGAVRGGFALKPQPWLINGQLATVADYMGPMSEGAVEVRWRPLALRMVREMMQRQPLLYSWGHGRFPGPMVEILPRLGWLVHQTPLCVYVHRPFRFLRESRYLRTSLPRALALDALAFSGLGAAGFAAYQRGRAVGTAWAQRGVDGEEFASFESWADALWEGCRSHYAALAVRDAEIMNALLPSGRWPKAMRLRVRRAGETIGWAAVMDTQFERDERFGALRVGSVIDCLALPRDSAAVVLAAKRFLLERRVDLIVSNQSHPAWVAAFAACGFLVAPERRLFAASPALRERLQPWTEVQRGLHLTNLDGHGPHLL
jgi:hypothetical protein